SCIINALIHIYRKRINTGTDKIPFRIYIAVILKLYMKVAVHPDILVIRIALITNNISLFNILSQPYIKRPREMPVYDLDTKILIRNYNSAAEIPVTFCS